MSKIDAYELARDVITRFSALQGVHPCFEHLMQATSGLAVFEAARIKIAVHDYNGHTESLVKRLEDVFESVYGKRPQVTVYTPHVKPEN